MNILINTKKENCSFSLSSRTLLGFLLAGRWLGAAGRIWLVAPGFLRGPPLCVVWWGSRRRLGLRWVVGSVVAGPRGVGVRNEVRRLQTGSGGF